MDAPSPPSPPDEPASSLRERKRQRAREAIVAAAYELFDEHGFDSVTVTDIAERAEVGRATFFRYFGDKQEVIFGADQRFDPALAAEIRRLAVAAPIGDALSEALGYVRRAMALLVARLVENPEAYRRQERIVAQHPELQARGLAKQRRYVEAIVGLLRERGTDGPTAALAAELGLACYHAGRRTVGEEPEGLPAAIDAAFARLERLAER